MYFSIDRVAILANEMAGKGKALKVLEQLTNLLTLRNISFDIYIKDWPTDFDDHSDIFLVGGDGTLNFFLNKYPENYKPLSLFKGGSGNDFAWKLYGDLSVEEYFKRVLQSEPRKVDAGICNGRLFINGVGIGFDGNIVRSMKGKRMFSAGHIAYMLAVMRSILFYLEKRMRLRFGRHDLQERFFMVTIANGERYGGGFVVAPGAEVNDGLFDIITINRIDPIRRMFHLPKVSSGKHLLLPFVKKYRTNEIHVSAQHILTGHYDGELLESREFNIRLLPSHVLIRY